MSNMQELNNNLQQLRVTEDKVELVCFRRLAEIKRAISDESDKDDSIVAFHLSSQTINIKVHSIETSGVYHLVIGEMVDDPSTIFRAFLKETPNERGYLGPARWFKLVCLICGMIGHMGLESGKKNCRGYCYRHRYPMKRNKDGHCPKCLEQDKLAH